MFSPLSLPTVYIPRPHYCLSVVQVTISTAVHASYAAVPQVSTLECTHEQGEEIELSYGNGFYIFTLE